MTSQLLAQQHYMDTLYRDVRSVITQFSFHRLGRIKTIYQDGDFVTRVTAEYLDFDQYGQKHMATGVELLLPGTKKYGERYNVEVGDYVLLLGFANPIVELKDDTAPAKTDTAFPYSGATMKALPIQPSTVAENHTVVADTDDGRVQTVHLPWTAQLGDTAVKVDADGAVELDVITDKCVATVSKDGDISLKVATDKFVADVTKEGAVTISVNSDKYKLEVTESGEATLTAKKLAITADEVDVNSGALVVKKVAES